MGWPHSHRLQVARPGVAAMACIAGSIVMIKPLLNRSPLLWVTQVRAIGGLAALMLSLLFFPSRAEIIKSVISIKNWRYMFPGSFLGQYLALLVWLGGMKYTQLSIASALNQTSNVFIFIFAAIFLKEAITKQKTIGIVLALIGVSLVMFGWW